MLVLLATLTSANAFICDLIANKLFLKIETNHSNSLKMWTAESNR